MNQKTLLRVPKRWRFAFLAALLSAGSAWATATIAARLSGTSSVQLSWDGVDYVGRKTTTDFNLHSIWDPTSMRGQILLLKSIASQDLNSDETWGHLELEARFEADHRFDQVAWRLSEQADSLEVLTDEGFVVTTVNGMYGHRGGNRAYDIRTGRLLFPYGSFGGDRTFEWARPFQVIQQTSAEPVSRFLGVLTRDATRDFAEETLPDGREKMATIVYADRTRILQTVHLFGPAPEEGEPGFDAEIVDLTGGNGAREGRNTLILPRRSATGSPSDVGGGFGIKIGLTVSDLNKGRVNNIEALVAFDGDVVSVERSLLPAGYRMIVHR